MTPFQAITPNAINFNQLQNQQDDDHQKRWSLEQVMQDSSNTFFKPTQSQRQSVTSHFAHEIRSSPTNMFSAHEMMNETARTKRNSNLPTPHSS